MMFAKKTIYIILGFILMFGLVSCQSTSTSTQSPEATDTQEAVDIKREEPYYVLIVGNDSRIGTVEINKAEYADGSGRSDIMILARIDPIKYQISLISVSRDTRAVLDGSTVKLNEVYRQKGIEALTNEVSALTGVPIKYYLDMDFVQFENFINSLSGIQVNVPINMSLQDIVSGNQISLSAGDQELMGPEALVLSRTRKAYANDHDACRQAQNRKIVEAGIQKVFDNPLQAAASAEILIANIDTNWDSTDLARSITGFVNKADELSFVSCSGPYKGDFDDSAGGLWLAYRDEATWQKIIAAVENGDDPNAIVPLPEVRAG